MPEILAQNGHTTNNSVGDNNMYNNNGVSNGHEINLAPGETFLFTSESVGEGHPDKM